MKYGAFGLVEVLGSCNAVMVIDQMLKTADVSFRTWNGKCGGHEVIFMSGDVSAVTAAVDTDIRKSQGVFFLKHRCKSINYTISLKAPLNYLILPHVGMILNSSLMLCQLSRRQNLYWRFVPLLHLYNCLRYKLEIHISSFLSF